MRVDGDLFLTPGDPAGVEQLLTNETGAENIADRFIHHLLGKKMGKQVATVNGKVEGVGNDPLFFVGNGRMADKLISTHASTHISKRIYNCQFANHLTVLHIFTE